MNAYAYDSNGIFAGKVKMQKDPLESKIQKRPVYLLPGNATMTPPPEVNEDQLAKWENKKWKIVSKPKPEPPKVKETIEEPPKEEAPAEPVNEGPKPPSPYAFIQAFFLSKSKNKEERKMGEKALENFYNEYKEQTGFSLNHELEIGVKE